MSSKKPIGFLDSGIGGVSVISQAIKLLPNEDYFFFSDSVNNPYGDKSDGNIISRCDFIADFLINKKNCKAVVIACNTASAKAVGFLREKYTSIPFIAIEPAYKMVHDFNPDGFTLVMATKGTLESEKFHRLYTSYDNHNTELLACVGLADLIEQNDIDGLKDYLNRTLGKYSGKTDNVVLGCTHYPLAKKEIGDVLGDVRFFDGAVGVSHQLKNVLAERDLLNNQKERGKIEFLDSSPTDELKKIKEKRFFNILHQEEKQ
ncbi:MAG: glutamate racemase [Clostridiales bacterium]|nr:glutamate racemase [Clostridiales bacterium]